MNPAKFLLLICSPVSTPTQLPFSSPKLDEILGATLSAVIQLTQDGKAELTERESHMG